MNNNASMFPFVLFALGLIYGAQTTKTTSSVSLIHEFNSANVAMYSNHFDVYDKFDGFMIRALNICKEPYEQDTDIMAQIQCDKTMIAFKMDENGIITDQSQDGIMMTKHSVGKYLLQSEKYDLQSCVMVVTVNGNRSCE